MKSKKILTGAVTLLAAVTLAACSSKDGGKDIVTMKGGTITSTEFYEEVEKNPYAQQVLVQMVIEDVLESKYGKKVTSKEVAEAYDKMAKQYGDAFEQLLATNGRTKETYRQEIRITKLIEYAVKEAAEKELTDESYKAAYDAYTPEVTAQVIKLADEAKAKEVLAKAQATGANFATLAKENSADKATAEKGGEVKFDSTSTEVPAEVRTAVFALNDGQVGATVVPTIDMNTRQQAFYVVKLNKKTEKNKDWKTYKDTLKEIVMKGKTTDPTFVQSVIGKALKDANVKVKDAAFQSALSQYITTSTDSSSKK